LAGKSWSHLVVRPLARPLIALGVTPNQITALHLALGLGVVGAAAWGTPQSNLWAGIVWLFACLLDRLDGEVARIGNLSSPWGHKFDFFVDNLLGALFFLGLGVGLRDAPFGTWAVGCGVVAAINLFVLNHVAEAFDSSADGEKILASKWGFDADDAFYLLGPLLWVPAAWREWAAILAAGATSFFLILFLRRLAALRRRQA
jgi:phosphatidylglycerophosphate synthase